MSDLYWLSDAQMAKLEPFFPKSHGKPRVDDRRVLSGIIFINRNGLRWRDAPVLSFRIQDKPHRSIAHFRGKLVRCLAHDAPSFSREAA